MKRVILRVILLVVIFLLPSSIAFAAPFLVSDPPTVNNVDYYIITGDPYTGFTGQIPDQANGSLRVDLATITSGAHNINVSACNFWGCSTLVPFSFTKSVPSAPTILQIVP